MSDPTDFVEQSYFGSGIEGTLRCHGDRYCTFDLHVDGRLAGRDRPRVKLDVLLQPCGATSWPPRGGPLCLLHESVQLVYSQHADQAIGRSWLPGVDPATAPRCYYRVTPQQN